MGPFNLLLAAVVLLVLGGTVVLVRTFARPQRKTYAFALAHGLPADPGELGLAFTQRQFRLSDGTVTPGWIMDGNCSSGPVIIVSHGWNSSRYGSLARVGLLADYASQLVVYDLRGHGDSTAPTCRMGTTEAHDLLQIVGQLDNPDQPIVLYGVSMGAGISIAAAAADEPQAFRIAAVIAEGPYRWFGEPIAGQLRCRQLPAIPFVHLASAYLAVRLGDLRAFDRAALAAKMRCPLLVLHGTHDAVCRLDSGQQIADAADQGKIVAIHGGGHGNLASVDAQSYRRAVETFLEPFARPQVTMTPPGLRQLNAVSNRPAQS